MPNETRSKCFQCGSYRIRSNGKTYKGKFICSAFCYGAFHVGEWIRWESERMKPKPATNVLELRRNTHESIRRK